MHWAFSKSESQFTPLIDPKWAYQSYVRSCCLCGSQVSYSVFLSVYLVVQLHMKTTDWVFVNILPEMYDLDKAVLIKFRKSSASRSDLETFWRIVQHCEIACFSSVSYLWKNWLDLHEDFTIYTSLDREVPIKYWKLCGSGLGNQTAYPRQIRLREGLCTQECSCCHLVPFVLAELFRIFDTLYFLALQLM